MIKLIRRFSVLVLLAAMIMAPIAAQATELSSFDEVTDGSIAGDFLMCRPLGIAATVIGSVLFVVSLPFSWLGDNVGQVANALVVEPAKFTFDRPLGKF